MFCHPRSVCGKFSIKIGATVPEIRVGLKERDDLMDRWTDRGTAVGGFHSNLRPNSRNNSGCTVMYTNGPIVIGSQCYSTKTPWLNSTP